TPNFENEAIIPRREWDVAELRAAPIDEVEVPLLDSAKQKLLALRQDRTAPAVDVKMITAWNGLTIRGLADAGRVFDNAAAIDFARDAAEFCLAKLRDGAGRLHRTYTSGEAKLAGYLDDYAFLLDGLIALYEATGESRWLEEAAAIADVQIELFADSSGGGFYYTASDQSQLLVRGKQPHDGPLPSSAAISARNLMILARKLNRSDFAELAESTLKSLAPRLAEVPAAMPRTAVLVEERLASEQKN
ncbi:MAG: thioredoxin domain-containing protein, partial [Planctomycetales bacterium]|nr:thioredoxin domain-containing protein [Planctomycetales bacterium]